MLFTQALFQIMTKCDNSKTNFDELLNWILNNKEKFETTKAFARKQEVKNLCKLKSKKRHHVDSIDSVIETVQKQRSTSEIASTEIDEQLKVCLEAIRVEEIIEKPPNVILHNCFVYCSFLTFYFFYFPTFYFLLYLF